MNDPFTISTQIRVLWLDTCTVAKIYIHEDGSENMRAVLANNSIWLFTADYCIHELYGILKRKAMKEKTDADYISLEEYVRIIFILNCHIYGKNIKVSNAKFTDAELFVEIQQIMREHDLDFVDAIQFVLIAKGMLGNLAGKSRPVLVSTDNGILKTAAQRGIPTWNPLSGPFVP